MQNNRGGFTLFEVMVVLAISSVVFFAAVTVFQGKQGKTEFSQGMHDIDSEFHSIVNDVGVSTFPDTNKKCTAKDQGSGVGQRPELSGFAVNGTGTNQDCIFLGKAVQLDDQSNPNLINIFTVLGVRVFNGTVVTDFANAQPEPQDSLTEQYTLPFGITVKSAKADTDSAKQTEMAGFYNSLQPSSGTDEGSQSLMTLAYTGFETKNNSAAGVKQAIRGLGPTPGEQAKSWTICFQSGTSNETAFLAIKASAGGITTNVTYGSCP